MSEESGRRFSSLPDPFRVAEWEIDVASHRLRRGGRVVKLEPRTMAVLVYLAARAGQVVTREELEEEVWSGRVVGYEALSNAIAKLRRAFEDHPKQPRIIETVPKAGYRLVAEVEGIPERAGVEHAEPGDLQVPDAVIDAPGHRSPPEHESPGGQTAEDNGKPVRVDRGPLRPDRPGTPGRNGVGSLPRRLAVGGLALVLVAAAAGLIWLWQWNLADSRVPSPFAAGKPSVAVLPFDNLSTDPAQEFFADGLTGDLITDLSRISGLFVIARHSVFAYKDPSTPVTEIADDLGVRFVVEGSVRRAEGRIRINAQLIDASTGMNLWAERYERDEMEVFALQDEVIDDIVDTLAVKLTDAERTQLARRGTDNLEAYDSYLRAERRRLGDWDSAEMRTAIALYRQAIALDPEFIDAYAGIAQAARETWQWDSSDIMPGAAARRLAYDAASKVLSLDEHDPRAYAVLAAIQAVEGRHEQALKSARSAVRLDPNSANAHATLAWILIRAGDHAEAQSEMETALRLNPRPPAYYHGDLGMIAFLRRDYETALAPLSRAGEHYTYYRQWLAMTYAELGRLDEARSEIEPIYEDVPFANLAYYRTMLAHFKRDEDREHMLAALEKADVPAWPYGYEPAPEYQLHERALGEITFGHTWTGHDLRGNRFIQQMTRDGRIVFRGHASLLTGNFRLKGNLLCVKYPGALLGREDCGYVYRNPDGGPEQKNKYVRVSVGDVYYFSVSPN